MIKYSLISFFLWVGFITQAQVNLDSLWGVWNNENASNSARAMAMHEISWDGYLYSQPDSAFYYAQKLYDFASTMDMKGEMAKALRTQGVCRFFMGNNSEAMDYYHHSLIIYEEISDKKGMAKTLNNIGVIYSNQGDYPKALDYYLRSLLIKEEISDKSGMASARNNIGIIYMNQGDYPNALDNFQRSLTTCEEISDKGGMAGVLSNIGLIYMEQEDYPQALSYHLQSLNIFEEISNKRGVAKALNNIGVIYMKQKDFTKALEYYHHSLEINEEISDKRGMANTYTNIGSINNRQKNYSQAVLWCKKGLKTSEEINILDEQKNACQCLFDAFVEMDSNSKALEYYERITKLDSSLQAEETTKKLQQMEFAKKILADSLIREEEKLRVQMAHDEEVREKNKTRNIFILSAFLLLIGAIALYRRIVFVRKAKGAIEKEKERSDNLLLNILPSDIAEELKEKGKADARKFEKVTILFTDFKGFTQISEKLSAEDLVEEINTCFKPFDAICGKYGIEKIKTIGDSYMAAGGLPVPGDESVKNTVLAGIEMTEFLISRKQKQESTGNICFEMRVGIHTGPVVAGIVGVTKFQYDIWGDTVNIASRIENSGEAGKVNISLATYELIKDDPIFKFQSRGKITTRGKGDIEMWFVEKAVTSDQ